MGSPSKRKGFAYEREVVKKFQEASFEAQRAYASDGRSLGLAPNVDIKVLLQHNTSLNVQAKRRKAIADYIKPDPNVDAQVIREDRGESYVVITLDTFIHILRQAYGYHTEETAPRDERGEVRPKGK